MSQALDITSISKNLVEIGRGGEGLVYQVRTMPDVVFKEFKNFAGHQPNRAALEAIISLPSQMETSDQQWLLSHTTWPKQIVASGSLMRGFIMPVIKAEYFRLHGARIAPKRVICEWNYLSMREKFRRNSNIVSEIPQVNPLEALHVVSSLARTMDVLHKYDMVIGDVSGRNLLWTDKPSFQVLVIDVDSFHFEGKRGVASPKQSPDWDDPYLGPNNNFTTKDSDRYKLALAAYRGVWAATTDRPDPLKSPVPPCPDGIPEAIRELVTRGLGPNDNRPTPREWVDAIKVATQFGGRPVVTIDGSGSTSRPSGNSTVGSTTSRGSKPTGVQKPAQKSQRPVITMKPNEK